MPPVNGVGEPWAREPHARFEWRALETGWPDRPSAGSGSVAEKLHHDDLVGAQPIDQLQPRQCPTLRPGPC